MAKLNAELIYRGKLGVQRRYHHPRHGVVETITMWGTVTGGDVVYVGHARWPMVFHPMSRRELARKAGTRRPRKGQLVSLQLLNFERSA